MRINRLYFNTALKALEDKNNFLVWWYPWNGMVRNHDGEEIGDVSTKIIDKLMESGKLETYGIGKDLLNHERYFRLMPKLINNTKMENNKGEFKQECNRTACNNKNAVFFNHSTLKYYCGQCAYEINKWAKDFRLEKGHELCVKVSKPQQDIEA